MTEILEIIMIVLFGASWPMNVIRAYRGRTAKGTSPLFLVMILTGYVAGILSKFTNPAYMAQIGQKWYVLFFYFLNLIMVSLALLVYFRNKRLDRQRESGENA